MRTIAVAILLSLGVVSAHAQTRADTTNMSCAQIRNVLDQNGSAILRHRSSRNASIVSSGVYVRDGRYCGIGQTAQPASVVAADTGNCRVQRCMSNARGR
jgi:hypothetical protein